MKHSQMVSTSIPFRLVQKGQEDEKRGPSVSAQTSAYLISGAQSRAPIANRRIRRSGAMVVFVPALIANQARYGFLFPGGSYPPKVLEKQKRPDIRIMEMLHDPDVRPFGDSLGLVQATDPLLGTSVLCALCQKLLASLYRKAPLFLASR